MQFCWGILLHKEIKFYGACLKGKKSPPSWIFRVSKFLQKNKKFSTQVQRPYFGSDFIKTKAGL